MGTYASPEVASKLRAEMEEARRRRKRRERNYLIIQLAIGVFALLFLVASLFRGLMVDPKESLRVADTFGFRNVAIVSTQWFLPLFAGCDAGDALAVNLAVTDQQGRTAAVLACSGWPWKGWTMRVK